MKKKFDGHWYSQHRSKASLGMHVHLLFPSQAKAHARPCTKTPTHTVTCKENLAHTLAQCVPFYKHKPGISVLW